MAFNLSSLLNPAPAGAAQEPPESERAAPSPILQRQGSLPSIQHLHSPEQQFATAPPLPYPSPYNFPPTIGDGSVPASAHALPSPTSWRVNSPPGQNLDGGWASDTKQYRSASVHGAPPVGGTTVPATRKMSSPSLEQYHVASRSPEQRRASMALLADQAPGFTLPPLQNQTVDQKPALQVIEEQDNSAVETVGSQPSGQTNSEMVASDLRPEPSHDTKPANLGMKQEDGMDGLVTPAIIKQEPAHSPQPSSPVDTRTSQIPTDSDTATLKAVTSLKSEHSIRQGSPLRASSVPVPSTEDSASEPVTAKKRPAPSRPKKGTATMTKKAPPAKKRKVERSGTPSSVSRGPKSAPLKAGSSKGTPVNSSPAPSTRSDSEDEADHDDGDEAMEDEDEDDEDRENDDDVYCICRKPDNGTFMIGCDGNCDDWFHGKCVGIEERDKNLIDKYMCPGCTQKGIGRTTWKRMCRRHGCRQPARVGKSGKGGRPSSKYCSDGCGVAHFRDMAARTRGREDQGKSRSSRRKSNYVSSPQPLAHDDLGARGGILAAGEVKTLIAASKSAEEFKGLGDGVLSPPVTPPDSQQADKGISGKDDVYTSAELESLAAVARQKDALRHRHQLLKDRIEFVSMVKQAAARAATEKELKAKDYCGYDPRLEWTEEEFEEWRKTKVGQQAFELKTLAVEKSLTNGNHGVTNGEAEESDAVVEDDERRQAESEVCERKKCARHLEWSKLAVDDLRFENADNSDRMRALDREEKDLRERAVLRSKATNINGEGSVELHMGRDSVMVSKEAESVVELPQTVSEDGATAGVNGTADAIAAQLEDHPDAMEIDTGA